MKRSEMCAFWEAGREKGNALSWEETSNEKY